MKTSPILNPVSLSASPMPKVQQAGGIAADRPFNQVLSREVAERRNAGEASKPGAKEIGKPSPKETAKAKDPNQAAVASQNVKPVEESKSEEADAESVAAPVAGDAATAQMLALAIQFGQANALPSDAVAASAEAPLADAPGRAVGIGKDGVADQVLIPGMPDLKQRTGPTEKQVVSEPSGFNPLTEQTNDQRPLPELAADKSKISLAAATPSTLDLPAAKNQEMQPALSAATLAPLQQAVFDKTQAITGHPAGKLSPQVGATGWDQALGQKMVWMVAGAEQSASLTLNPPDLGPLQVVLNVSNSQATANFIAAQPEVRQALEAAMPKLREMLGDAGIQLGQANVSAGTPNQNGSFREQPQASRRTDQAGSVADTPLRVTRSASTTTRNGMVDTFA